MATRLRRKTESLKKDDLTNRIAVFIDAHHVMSLATYGRTGPHAANLLYARDGLSLVWVSDRESTHSTNIGTNPQVSVTIAPALRRLSGRSTIKQAYSSAEAYRFVPARIIMIDNRRGFAHKDTLDLKPVQK